jgi:RNA polymerase sigma-32 factor
MNLGSMEHDAEERADVADSFRMYLHEASKHPLLSKEEERELAERIRAGRDKEAEQALAVANLRLVVKIALDYHSCRFDVLDLIQEGNIGLVLAVKKYDPERGTRFSTYASFWIRAYILKYLMDSWSVVRIGAKDSHRKLFYSLNREKERLEKAGIDPSAEVLAENLDVTPTDIEDMEKRLYNADVSLEGPLYEVGKDMMDMIGSGEDIEETVVDKERKEMVRNKLIEFKKMLSERECFILDHRILAEEPITLREIGERFNASRESIRLLESKIFRKLKKNLRASMAQSSVEKSCHEPRVCNA